MNTTQFAAWLGRQGHQIAQSESALWFDPGPRILEALPYHAVLTPQPGEVERLLRRERAIAARYFSPWRSTGGLVSYHVLREDTPYEMEHLNPKARNKVRRGLRNCTVAPISLEQMMEDGWALQVDTLSRHQRIDTLTGEQWRRIFTTVDGLPDFEAWGAFVDGALASNVLIATVEGVCYLLYQCSHQDYFRQAANNALVYTVTRECLARPSVRMIFYSTHSLDAPASVDDFKFSMDYHARPFRQHIQFHPYLAFLFNRSTHRLVQWLAKRVTSNALSKAEGMIRFYLEGKWPAAAQEWPSCLQERREELLRQGARPSPAAAAGRGTAVLASPGKGGRQ